ncbi:MAG: DUF3307 domain-containing protein [Thermoleophilaceae bacterium]
MDWVEVFLVFLVSHLVGDFGLQTEWQAAHKHGGLSLDARSAESRRALLSHVTTYTLAFVPALIWLGSETGVGTAVAAAALVFLPHYLQDDGRLLAEYMRRVKGTNPADQPFVAIALDQTFHLLFLFGLGLLVAS